MDYLDFIKTNQNYFEDFITRSTYHTNTIEGSTLSYAETYAIIFNDNSFKINAIFIMFEAPPDPHPKKKPLR